MLVAAVIVSARAVMLAVVVAEVELSVYLDAAVPLRVMPLAVTVFPFPTFLLENVALPAVQVALPTSPASTPVSVQAVIVAVVAPS